MNENEENFVVKNTERMYDSEATEKEIVYHRVFNECIPYMDIVYLAKLIPHFCNNNFLRSVQIIVCRVCKAQLSRLVTETECEGVKLKISYCRSGINFKDYKDLNIRLNFKQI